MCWVRFKNLGNELADVLSERIIKSEYKPGERIVESRVAAEMRVSQSSVREALRILQQNGLVEINQRKGTYVTVLSKKDVVFLYEMLAGLYSILVRESMKNLSADDLPRIVNVMKSLQEAADKGDADAYYNGMFAFADMAIESVNSPLLKKTVHDLWQNKKRIEYLTLKARSKVLKGNFKYFKQLEKYIKNGDTDNAVKTISDYLGNELAIALNFFKE